MIQAFLSLPTRSLQPVVKRATLTIITPAPVNQPEPDLNALNVPPGWKACFTCKGQGTKGGLWASAGRNGTRNCDVCDGNCVVPENEPEPTSDLPAHYGYPEGIVSPSYED